MVAMSPMWLLSTQSEGSIEELIFYFILFNFKIKWPPVASVDNIGRLWCKEEVCDQQPALQLLLPERESDAPQPGPVTRVALPQPSGWCPDAEHGLG